MRNDGKEDVGLQRGVPHSAVRLHFPETRQRSADHHRRADPEPPPRRPRAKNLFKQELIFCLLMG